MRARRVGYDLGYPAAEIPTLRALLEAAVRELRLTHASKQAGGAEVVLVYEIGRAIGVLGDELAIQVDIVG